MKLYSTNNKNKLVDLREAVLKGLPEDNGLYMPFDIPKLPTSFLDHLTDYTFQEIAYEVAANLIQDSIPPEELQRIIYKSIDFPAPVISLDRDYHILELFHGPSLAFKDFGARFMAQTMSYFNRDENSELVILVATSGDTGGAVATGFYDTPGIKVVILYPSGKVSKLQEKQLTTLGKNITALEVDGTFDDCQALVKKAFLDEEMQEAIRLSSANSINIARLIPQSFYYFEAYKQLDQSRDIVFTVPSGNFGNLTAGILAKKMGLPISHFIAATNVNDIVPNYLSTGVYEPKASVSTISNAMDVGNPSNFKRMGNLYHDTWDNMRNAISGFRFTDKETREGIREVYEKYNYIIDPHGAVGYLAFQEYLKNNYNSLGVILETAHPSKFVDVVQEILPVDVPIPERLAELANEQKVATSMTTNYTTFKDWLLANY